MMCFDANGANGCVDFIDYLDWTVPLDILQSSRLKEEHKFKEFSVANL